MMLKLAINRVVLPALRMRHAAFTCRHRGTD